MNRRPGGAACGLLVCVIGLAGACTRAPAEPEQRPRAAQPAKPVPPGQPVEPVAPPPVPATDPIVPPPRPIPVVRAEPRELPPYELREAPSGRRLLPRVRSSVREGYAGDDRIFVSDRSKAYLIDLDSGATLATLARVDEISDVAGIAVGRTEHDVPVIVHLDSGELVVPTPVLPGTAAGQAPTQILIAAYGRHIYGPAVADVWLFARTEAGTIYAGPWSDLHDASPTLAEEFPFWPTNWSGTDRLEVRRGDGSALEADGSIGPDCVRIAVGDGRPPVCRAAGKSDYMFGVEYLGQGWSFEAGELLNPERRRREALFSDCIGALNVSMRSPARIVGFCARDDGDRDYVLWSPEGRLGWREAKPGNATFLHAPVGKPVVGISQFWRMDEPTARWIDLEGGRIIETETLQPLSILADTRKHVLAQVPGPGQHVRHLSVDEAYIETVADIEDCPGDLTMWDSAGDYVSLLCQIQKEPGLHVFDFQWAEIVDTRRRIRWRTRLYPEALFASGRFVASGRKRSAAESALTRGKVYVIDL